MGYYMYQHATDFFIGVDEKPNALIAVKKLARSNRRYDWVDDFGKAKTLEEALEAWHWTPEVDCEGNIYNITFDGEKLGDEDILWETIAPYVKDGSFIQMSGEDDGLWRWVFVARKMVEVNPTILWPTVEEIRAELSNAENAEH